MGIDRTPLNILRKYNVGKTILSCNTFLKSHEKTKYSLNEIGNSSQETHKFTLFRTVKQFNKT